MPPQQTQADRTKRKHEEQNIDESNKKQKTEEPPEASTAHMAKTTTKDVKMKFPGGALRITRTPGRKVGANTITLDDLIESSALTSAFVFTFFIAQGEFFDHLPFKRPETPARNSDNSKSREDIPIYVGRDVNLDERLEEALVLAKFAPKNGAKLKQDQLKLVRPLLEKIYIDSYGKNFKAVYPWCSGCAHSKVLVLIYKDFMRIVITSANMMNIDTVLGDNHWYIHDLPLLPTGQAAYHSTFENDFLEHLEILACPAEFIDSIRGCYDYRTVKVSLVTSKMGAQSGKNAQKYGLLRLRSAISDFGISGITKLEYCAGSIGKLNANWLSQFYQAATNSDEELDLEEKAPLTIVFPTPGDVRRCPEDTQHGASNVGCHLRPWPSAPPSIKQLFHHYTSRDDGRLFHMKLLMGFGEDTTIKPKFIYIGSHNFSQGAWGQISSNAKGEERMTDMSNIECGVVIPGFLIDQLLEGVGWQDGVVPYVRPAASYKSNEKAWNDPRWAGQSHK